MTMRACFFLLALCLPLAATAQFVAEPEALSVTVAQGEETERTVTLTNSGSETVSFCLSFERPLQREGRLRLSERTVGAACGEVGEILYEVSDQTIAIGWDPYGLAMTPEGRLFVADNSSLNRTHELTLDLKVIRSFDHPLVAELHPFPTTRGVTYNADTGTLWWLNIERCSPPPPGCIARAMLLEGNLDGIATGRRIELPITESPPPDKETIDPYGVSYDPALRRYYYSDAALDAPSRLWAIDTLGSVIPGYPVEQDAYPETPSIGFGPDVYGGAGGEAEAVRVELTMFLEDSFGPLVVVDPLGHDLGIETPVPDVSGGTGFGSLEGEPLRSRVDPNGVLYFPFVNFDAEGIVGIRPHPLPPSWLALSQWDGELEPGESVEINLTFKASTRAVGNTYSAALQVFEAETGEALEVPLSLEVTESTAGEDGPSEGRNVSALSVYPNPLSSAGATVALTLGESSGASVEVFDVLGRRVAVLHEGRLAAGDHIFAFDTAHLPGGVYLVRAVGPGFAATRPVAVLR